MNLHESTKEYLPFQSLTRLSLLGLSALILSGCYGASPGDSGGAAASSTNPPARDYANYSYFDKRDPTLALGVPISSGCNVEIPEVARNLGQPVWIGRCFNGFGQGPGLLAFHRGGTHYLTASGLVINGRFVSGPFGKERKSADSIFSGSEDYGGEFDIRKIDKEQVEVLEKLYDRKYLATSPLGCKIAMTGLFDDFRFEAKLKEMGAPINREFDDLQFGDRPWLVTKDMSTTRGLLPQGEVVWTGECVDGYAEGRGGVFVDIYYYSFENVIRGEVQGKIKKYYKSEMIEKYKPQYVYTVPPEMMSAYYFKGVWARTYKDYLDVIRKFEKYGTYVAPAEEDLSAKIIADRFNVEANDDRTKLAAEKALEKVWQLKLAVGGEKGGADRWSDSFLGLNFTGVQGNSDIFVNWDIQPRAANLIDPTIKGIKIDLKVVLKIQEMESLGWYGQHNNRFEEKVVTIRLDRAKGFKDKGSSKLFNINTYMSALGERGYKKQVEDVQPEVSIQSISSY